MSELFKKLNLKHQQQLLLWQVPDQVEAELAHRAELQIAHDIGPGSKFDFALLFVSRQQELDLLSRQLPDHLDGDAVLWFAYPKQSSRRFSCEFNRDRGWDVIRACGFDSVRMVAIDQDWSALRMRRCEYIGS